MFFTPCLRLITELWASRKLNNEASLCWASWGENDFYLQKKKSHFRPEGFALRVCSWKQSFGRPVNRSILLAVSTGATISHAWDIDYIHTEENFFTPSHSPTILSVPRTRYQTKTHRIVPGLLPVFSRLKADMSISRVAKLCDVVSIFQLAYHWTRSWLMDLFTEMTPMAGLITSLHAMKVSFWTVLVT